MEEGVAASRSKGRRRRILLIKFADLGTEERVVVSLVKDA